MLARSPTLGRLAKRPLCPAGGSVFSRTACDGFKFGGLGAAFPRMYGLGVTGGPVGEKAVMVRLFGGSCERVARSVEAETEMAMVAVMAPIGADEENPAKDELQKSLSSRSMDRRASATGTAGMMCKVI